MAGEEGGKWKEGKGGNERDGEGGVGGREKSKSTGYSDIFRRYTDLFRAQQIYKPMGDSDLLCSNSLFYFFPKHCPTHSLFGYNLQKFRSFCPPQLVQPD